MAIVDLKHTNLMIDAGLSPPSTVLLTQNKWLKAAASPPNTESLFLNTLLLIIT